MNFQHGRELKGDNIDQRYNRVGLDKSWPFNRDMRLVTKGKRSINHEIILDHINKEYLFIIDGRILRGKTPTKILREMAINGIIGYGTANSNWSSLWATVDNGATYVLGLNLSHRHCISNGIDLVEGVRHYIPSTSL